MRSRRSSRGNPHTEALALVLISAFIDMIGFSLTIPVLPFLLINEYKIPESEVGTWYGIIVSAYSCAELLGTAIIGPLSDRIGRRPVLLISLFGSGVGFIGQGMAPTVYWLLGLRIIAGLFGSTKPVAEAYITDYTNPAERPKYMGFLSASVGIAFMFGPAIGAGLAEFSLRTPYFVATGVACLAFLISLWKLPESKKRGTIMQSLPEEIELRQKEEKSGEEKFGEEKSGEEKSGEEKSEEEKPGEEKSGEETSKKKPPKIPSSVIYLVILGGFFLQLSFQSYITVFPIMTKRKFSFSQREIGFVFTGTSLTFVLTNALLYGPGVKRCGMVGTASVGTLFFGGGMLLVPIFNHLGPTFVGLGALAIGYAFASPSIPTLLSLATPQSKIGKMLAFSAGTQTFARVIGPTLLGTLASINDTIPFLVSGGVGFFAFLCFLLVSCAMREYETFEKIQKVEMDWRNLIAGYQVIDPEKLKKEDIDLTEEEKKAALELGLFMGRLYKSRNYKEWIKYMEVIKNLQRDIFPVLDGSEGANNIESLHATVSNIQSWGSEWQSAQAQLSTIILE